MSSSFRVLRIDGVEIRIHALFVALVVLVSSAAYVREGSGAATWEFLTMIGVFGSVLLHEFGHVYAARMYGIRTSDVTLLPFGGLASLDRMPQRALEQAVVAISGPLVNLLIVVVLVAAGFWREGEVTVLTIDGFMEFLIFANAGLLIFNLIPAFPMDGGRLLKAFLQCLVGHGQALRMAAILGQGIAVLFLLYAIYWFLPMLAFVAVFIFVASAVEAGRHPLWFLRRGSGPSSTAGAVMRGASDESVLDPR